MSSSRPEAPLPRDVNRGGWLLAIFWIEVGIQTIVVVLRLYVRRVLRNLGWDDWTMLAAHILSVATISLATAFVLYGGGRHIYYVPFSHRAKAMELNLLCQSFDTITLIFGKLSVIFLILRLMGNISRWRKWMLYSVAIFFPIVAVLNVILTFVQCNPPHALWEPQTKDVKCWNPNVQIDFLVVASGYSALSDYFLALVPATFIWHLQMSLQKKITLCILLGLGLVGGTAAIVKTIQIRDLIQREDITWFAFTVYIWASIEVFLNIICGSIPTLSPLYDKCIKGKPLRPSNARAYHTRISSQPAAEFTWSPHLPSGMEQTHFTDSSQRSIWRHGTSDEDSIGIAQTITTSLEAK